MLLRTISNRIRIEYIWLQHMIQVRILGNNKGARHPQDLRQWPLSFLLCQTPAFLQQSFFPTKGRAASPPVAQDCPFYTIWPLDMIDCWYGPVRRCYISCHGSLHRSASHSRHLYWFHLQESTSPPQDYYILNRFLGGISQPGRVQWRVFPLADLAPGSRAIPPEVPEFSRKFYI